MAKYDSELQALVGSVIDSERLPGVHYRVDRILGEGGLGVVFFALRDVGDTVTPVVLKVVRPAIVAARGELVQTIVKKEVVALGRLAEQVPPTPYVVRALDTGVVVPPGARVALPWIALEHVHGGIEGTTLQERVELACAQSGSAFDPRRTLRALTSVASGLAAIHSVEVVHRDIAPGNVLCCGSGEQEIFKISDFGLARVENLETFGDVPKGTPGYAAPEQNFPGPRPVGEWSDTFSLACVVYFMLAGDDYFDAQSIATALLAVQAPRRKALAAARRLCPELRRRPDVTSKIDRVLAAATHEDPELRPRGPQALAAALTPLLRSAEPAAITRTVPRYGAPEPPLSPVEVRDWQWSLHAAPESLVVRDVAWDSDGHCLAATTRGVHYWSGTEWRPVAREFLAPEVELHCVHRAQAGTWILGGDGVVVVYSTGGIEEIRRGPPGALRGLSGSMDELLLAIVTPPNVPAELWSSSGRRWHRSFTLPELSVVNSLARIDATTWIVGGRKRDGSGTLAYCRPLERSFEFLAIPPTSSIVKCASRPEAELGLAIGLRGVTVSVHGGAATATSVEGAPNLSACAVDVLQREWVGGLGKLWVKEPGRANAWHAVWSDPDVGAPIVSLLADVDLVLGVTAHGAVVEGRAPWRS